MSEDMRDFENAENEVAKLLDIVSFSDIAVKSTVLDGPKVKIADVFDKEIVVLQWEYGTSKYKDGPLNKIQFYFKDDNTKEKRVLFTGSGVINKQLKSLCDKYGDIQSVPEFSTQIVKESNYYLMK